MEKKGKNFSEVCFYEGKPDKTEEFEALIRKVIKNFLERLMFDIRNELTDQ